MGKDAVPGLIQALQDENLGVCRSSERALRKIGTSEALKAVEEYQSLGDRGTEMAEKIQFEIDFLSEWLPEQLSDEDVEKIVDEVLNEMGEVDISQMGKVIGAVMAKGDGIDGGTVSKIVKEKLS